MKLENVLTDSQGQIRLCDFGLRAHTQGDKGEGFLQQVRGTGAYMPPEMHARQKYSGEAADIFALGVMIFTMRAGRLPFKSSASATDPLYKFYAECRESLFWQAHTQDKPDSFYSPEFRELVDMMLAHEPSCRLSLGEVATHPFFDGEVLSAAEVKAEVEARRSHV